MPPKTRARPLTGGSKFMELMKKARKAGVVSKGLRAVAPHTKRSALLEKIAGVAESEGYGRRRRIAGRGPGMDKFKAKAKQAWQLVKNKKNNFERSCNCRAVIRSIRSYSYCCCRCRQ